MTLCRVFIFIALGLLFSGMCVLENGAQRLRPEEPVAKGVSSIYALAGEFRTVFANLLWIKADHYNDEFTEHGRGWSQNTDLLGLMKIITSLDPHFVEAYEAGAYVYADGCKDGRGALAYLREGIAGNPKAWELHKLAALLYARRLHDTRRAIRHARLALKFCDDDWERTRIKWLLRSLERLPRTGGR